MDTAQMTTALIERVREEFPDGVPNLPNYGYPESLALCAIDSVYSLAARYTTARNAVRRYSDARHGVGGTAAADSLRELLEAIDSSGGALEAASSLFDNRQMAPGTKRRKSEALYGAAKALVDVKISTVEDLRAASTSQQRLESAKKAWTDQPGLGYASWRYLLMLAGVPGVKTDRMILRYMKSVGEGPVTNAQVEAAFAGAATELGVKINELDNAIWRKQSGRNAR